MKYAKRWVTSFTRGGLSDILYFVRGEIPMNEKDEFEFIKEKIVEKPINKKKLLKRTIITVSMAVIFGLVACITFLVLEPVFSNWLYPEEAPKEIVIPEEVDVTDEVMPEDMLQEDILVEEEEEIEAAVQPEIVYDYEFEIKDYQTLYAKLSTLATEASKSIVTVTGITSDVDWFNNPYQSEGQSSGLIVADNGKQLLILVEQKNIDGAERIQVTFNDQTNVDAILKKNDPNTGLSIIAVDLELLEESTIKRYTIATLGSSAASATLGTTVIALGSPMGIKGSMCYGMITSATATFSVVDKSYKVITTDIYGSSSATGILVNMKGEVIGIINQTQNATDMKNILSAIGITELKSTITKLSNQDDTAYLGIFGKDVTVEANESLGVPFGTYIYELELESPAMNAGIQNGDVIVSIDGTDITNYAAYINMMSSMMPEQEINIKIMRQSMDGYQEMEFVVTLGTLE